MYAFLEKLPVDFENYTTNRCYKVVEYSEQQVSFLNNQGVSHPYVMKELTEEQQAAFESGELVVGQLIENPLGEFLDLVYGQTLYAKYEDVEDNLYHDKTVINPYYDVSLYTTAVRGAFDVWDELQGAFVESADKVAENLEFVRDMKFVELALEHDNALNNSTYQSDALGDMHTYECDLDSQYYLNSAITRCEHFLAQSGGDDESIEGASVNLLCEGSDGVLLRAHMLSQLKAVKVAEFVVLSALYEKHQQLKILVKQATTAEEIDAVTWPHE